MLNQKSIRVKDFLRKMKNKSIVKKIYYLLILCPTN